MKNCLRNSLKKPSAVWPVVAISVVALCLPILRSAGFGFTLGWNPSPAREEIQAYLVNVYQNHPTNLLTNVWVREFVTETNVVTKLERRGINPELQPFPYTNVITRLPTCAVVTNLPATNVYWATVTASNRFGVSPPSRYLVVFNPVVEERVSHLAWFTNNLIHMEVPVEMGWHYYLKSSHGTPEGSFDHCCGTFVTNHNKLHWNRLAENDYLGTPPTNATKLTFVIPALQQPRHQLYKVYRAQAPDAITNATKNHSLRYE